LAPRGPVPDDARPGGEIDSRPGMRLEIEPPPVSPRAPKTDPAAGGAVEATMRVPSQPNKPSRREPRPVLAFVRHGTPSLLASSPSLTETAAEALDPGDRGQAPARAGYRGVSGPGGRTPAHRRPGGRAPPGRRSVRRG